MLHAHPRRTMWALPLLAACLVLAPAAALLAGPEGDKGEKKEPELPKFEEVTKNCKEVLGPMGESGFLPLFYNEKKDQLFCVIPRSILKKNILIATSIAGGPTFAGYMWGDMVVQWHEMDDKLVLIEPDLRYKRNTKSSVDDAVNRTYTDRIVLATKIVSRRNGDVVIDLGDVLKKDFAQIGRVYGGNVDPSLSRFSERKAFPLNVELTVDAAVMQGQNQGGTRAAVHYSIVQLPENDYKPREADPRVGYFLTAVKDWSADHDADTIFKRLIHRWDVRKAEQDKAVSDCDPDHQIVFYIEKTVPVQYRRYVREGILLWNQAFEKAGIRNAVRVEQQTDTVHAEKDPEDVRYAFFRWIVSGRSFAMGPSLANPLTGQILDADIIMDDSMARAWEMQYARYSGTGLAWYDDEQLAGFLKQYPQWAFVPRMERLLPEQVSYSGVHIELEPEVQAVLKDKHGYCTYAAGLAHEMALNMAMLEATGNTQLSEEYVGQFIKEVTAHEVGHTLGLRHNFKASSWKSIEDITSNTDHSVPTCGSVMDYNPGMFNNELDKQGVFVTQNIGPYDEWAIAYGYAIPDGKEHKDDEALLKSIVARVAEPGLAYATDEDTTFFSPDPTVNRFDNGDDVIAYARQRMDMVRRLQKDMTTWAVEDGESYNKLRRTFDMLLAEYGRASSFAARYVGGQYITRDHKGDPNARPPITIVPAAKQREALDFLVATIFSDKDFQFDPEVLNKLAAGRWSHWDSDAFDSQLDYPVHDRIAGVQYQSLFTIMNPATLDRVYDAEVKVAPGEEALTIPELLGRVTDAVWGELEQPVAGKTFDVRNPYVSSIRRSLQRQHLQVMINLVLTEPGTIVPADVTSVATLKLRKLSDRIGKTLTDGQGKLDDFSRAHFDEAKSRIDRALEAKYSL